jgi:hypothetical protein
VKYAQCVKIWPFDVLILFLKCVQFLKPCVQFLMDTILNPAIVKFLMKKKGNVHYGACLLCQEKGDACCGGTSRISGKGRHTLWGHVSLLPNSTKKTVNKIFSTGFSLHQY